MQASLPLSSFEWNRRFIESCQVGNLKLLDLTFYFSLEHPSSKRLYRFLDKRFYRQAEWVFDLAEIAFERVGLSRNYTDAGKIKEKLQPAIEELEAKGFIRPMTRDERYFKEGKVWKIRFVHTPPALAAAALTAPAPAEAEPPLVAEMARRGVTRATASELVRQHPPETIQAKIEVLDWLVDRKDKRVEKSPAGYLVKSIEKDYAAPKGFLSRAERQRREEERQARERQAAEAQRRKREEEARDKAEQKAVTAYWESLTSQQQADLQAKADAKADPTDLARETGVLKRIGQQIRRNEHIRDLLRNRERVAEDA